MADLYDRLKTTAQSMIAKYGRPASIISFIKTGSSYNPVISVTLTPIYLLQSEYQAKEIDGTLIKTNDKRFLIYSETAISTENKILDNNKKYSIVSIKETMPGSVNLLYEVQARL